MSSNDASTSKATTRRVPVAASRIVKVLMLAAVVHFFVIPQIGGARSALSVIKQVSPSLLGLAVLLEALALFVYAWLTVLLLPSAERPPLRLAFGTVVASTGVNHVVPGGAATTAAVNFRLLGNAGVPRNSLGVALGTQAIGSAVVLNLILWCALIVSIPTSGFHPIYASAAGVGAFLIALVVVAAIGLRQGSERFADGLLRIVGRLRFVNEATVRSTTLQASRQLDELLRDRRRSIVVLILAAANWLFDAAALYVSLSAFGTRPGIDGLLVAYGLANVMAAIPITPGGLGVIEAILIPTLVGFGVPASEASVGVVAYRLISYWTPIPIGGLCYLLVDRSNARREGSRPDSTTSGTASIDEAG